MKNLRVILSATTALVALSTVSALADGASSLIFNAQSPAFQSFTLPSGESTTDGADLDCRANNQAFDLSLGGTHGASQAANAGILLNSLGQGEHACTVTYDGYDEYGDSLFMTEIATFNLNINVVNNNPSLTISDFVALQPTFSQFYYFVNGKPVQHPFTVSSAAGAATINIADVSAR